MSTLTSLISAGGGGGGSQTHIITDPKLLNRLAAPLFNIMTSNSDGSSTFNRNSAIGSFFITTTDNTGLANTGFSSTVAVTAADTYATLLDTSNADGGYLYWILGCAVTTASDTSTFKITVDGGAPYEIQYVSNSAFANIRPFLGSGCSTAVNNGATSGTMTNANDFWNATTYGMAQWTTAQIEDSVNGFWSTQYKNQAIIADFGLLDNSNFQKLYFTTSLKIEVKQSNYQTINVRNRAACLYKLL